MDKRTSGLKVGQMRWSSLRDRKKKNEGTWTDSEVCKSHKEGNMHVMGVLAGERKEQGKNVINNEGELPKLDKNR